MKMDKNMPVYSSLDDAISDLFDKNTEIEKERPVSGGDIHTSSKLDLTNGKSLFLKRNTLRNLNMFQTEASGLKLMADTKTIGIPTVHGILEDYSQGVSGIIMEYVTPQSKSAEFWKNLGEGLALMHKAPANYYIDKKYGFREDNYIGLTPQKNDTKEDWVTFFRDCRLEPQINMARDLIDVPMRKKLQYLLDHLDQFLWEPDDASVLHGDLWSGNMLCGAEGSPWLIDPAAYIGDSETDLAMTQLFGGFSPVFYEAYHGVKPIDPGYRDRKKIYQLYHLLNHVNLFGRSYLYDVADILQFYKVD